MTSFRIFHFTSFMFNGGRFFWVCYSCCFHVTQPSWKPAGKIWPRLWCNVELHWNLWQRVPQGRHQNNGRQKLPSAPLEVLFFINYHDWVVFCHFWKPISMKKMLFCSSTGTLHCTQFMGSQVIDNKHVLEISKHDLEALNHEISAWWKIHMCVCLCAYPSHVMCIPSSAHASGPLSARALWWNIKHCVIVLKGLGFQPYWSCFTNSERIFRNSTCLAFVNDHVFFGWWWWYVSLVVVWCVRVCL